MYLLFFLIAKTCLFGQLEPKLGIPIGHTSSISSVRLSHNQKVLLSGSTDNVVSAWDAKSGKILFSILDHSQDISSISISNDDSLMLSASAKDSVVYVWNLSTGKKTRTIDIKEKYKLQLISAEFVSENQILLVATNQIDFFSVKSGKRKSIVTTNNCDIDKAEQFYFGASKNRLIYRNKDLVSASVVSTNSDKNVRVLNKRHKASISVCSLNRSNELALTTDVDGELNVWDANSASVLHTFSIGQEIVNAFFCGDKEVVVQTKEKVLWIDLNSKVEPKKVYDFQDRGSHFCIEIDGGNAVLIVDNRNAFPKIVNLKNGDFRDLRTNEGLISFVGYNKSINQIVIGYEDGNLDLISLDNERIMRYCGYTQNVNSFVLSDDNKYLFTALSDGTCRKWDIQAEKQIGIFKNGKKEILKMELSKDNSILMSLSADERLCLFNANSMDTLLKVTEKISNANMSPDGSRLLANIDGIDSLFIWDLQKKNKISTLQMESSNPFFLFSNTGKYFIYKAKSGLKLMESVSLKEIEITALQKLQYASIIFDNTDSLLLIGCEDGAIHCIDINVKKEVKTFFTKGQKKTVTDLKLSKNGAFLISSSDDPFSLLWDMDNGVLKKKLKVSSGLFRIVQISNQGDKALISNTNNSVYVFDLKEGIILDTLMGHNRDVEQLAFSAHDDIIISLGRDHKLNVWDGKNFNVLFTFLQLKGEQDWLVYDDDFHFSGNQSVMDKLYVVCENEIISLKQVKEVGYVPGLTADILNHRVIKYKGVKNCAICGALAEITLTGEFEDRWEYKLTLGRLPLKELVIKVDGSHCISVSDSIDAIAKAGYFIIQKSHLVSCLSPGMKNVVEVIPICVDAENGTSHLSRGATVTIEETGEKHVSHLWMIMVGVNDYRDNNLDLLYPSQDARDLGLALKESASALLSENNVHVYNIQTPLIEGDQVFATPEKVGIQSAFSEIGQKAHADDILFIFFGGHGTVSSTTNLYTLMTADASQDQTIGVSTEELSEWLSPDGPYKMAPKKKILIFDACGSAQAIMDFRAKDDQISERQRQIQKLSDKNGMFILAAAPPHKPAYEFDHIKHGMLTYSLLHTLKHNDAIADGELLKVSKWFLNAGEFQNKKISTLGCEQNAEPFIMGDIIVGEINDAIRNSIILEDEKPMLRCYYARNKEDMDPLDIKNKLNTELQKPISRPFCYTRAINDQVYEMKIIYNEVTSDGMINYKILLFKGKVKKGERVFTSNENEMVKDIIQVIPTMLNE